MIMIYPSEITKKWPHRPLSEVVDFLDSKRKPITQKDRVPGPYPYYGANGQQDSVADYIFDEPLVLLAEDGGHFGDADKTIAYQVEGKCWVNNHAHVLRPKKDVDIRYICRHLERYDVTPFITGSTRGKLTKTAANNIPIALPPLEEQRRIAAILDKADGVRRKRKEAIRLTEELLKSTFLEMFGDPVTNPKGWEVTILRDVCKKVTDGTHHMPKTVEKGIPILRALNIKKDKVETSNLLYISEEDYQKISKRSPLDKGDVLLTCLGTIGNVAIFNEDSNFSLVRNIALLKPNYKKTTSEFLKFILKTDYLQRQIKSRSKQSSQAALYIGEIEQLKIFLPPIELQRKYSNLSQEINDLHKKLEQDEFYQDNLFNSLLQKAFRGEL